MAVNQLQLRELTLEAVNDIIHIEGGSLFVSDVRIIPAPMFFDFTHGTAILLEDGTVALRIAAERPPADVMDTILHETAHVLLGPEHVDQPNHGAEFQALFEYLKVKYSTAPYWRGAL